MAFPLCLTSKHYRIASDIVGDIWIRVDRQPMESKPEARSDRLFPGAGRARGDGIVAMAVSRFETRCAESAEWRRKPAPPMTAGSPWDRGFSSVVALPASRFRLGSSLRKLPLLIKKIRCPN